MTKTKVIKCQDCGQNFAFTTDQQQYYQQQGLDDPKICRVCRGVRKAGQQDDFRGQVKSSISS